MKVLLSALVVLLAGSAFCGEGGPGLPVTVFYSKEDKRWPEAEKILDQAAKDLQRIELEKVAIDDQAGYARLKQFEQENPGREPGEITVVIGPYSLISKGERRDVELYFASMMRRLFNMNEGKGRLNPDPTAYAAELFGKEAKVEKLPKKATGLDVELYRVVRDGQKVGVLADVYSPIGCPVCNDAQFLLGLSVPKYEVLGLRPVRELERYGRPLEMKEAQLFLNQFKGKSPDAAAAQVDGISGATRTVNSYSATITKLLSEIKQLEQTQ